jgi:hypothetical protein
MAYDLNSFRFANPTTAAQTQFNNTMGLGGQNNVNTAYSNFLAGPNTDPNATQEFQQAWGPQWNDPTTNADQYHKIVGTYIQGGNNLLGNGYTYIPPTRAAQQAGATQTFNQLRGVPLNQIYGNSAAGSGYPANPATSGTGTPTSSMTPTTSSTTAATPGTGASNPANPATPPNYSTYITNPSAYLNPDMQFQMDQGMNQLKNAAGAQGNLLSGQTLKAITGYSQGLAGQDWQQAFNNSQTDANRLYGIDNADRNFAYNAATGDRNFNAQQQYNLAQMGLQGTNSNSQLSAALANILSNNSIAAGQAQGTGTIGANNALGSSLSSIIQQLYQNNMLSQYGNQYGLGNNAGGG